MKYRLVDTECPDGHTSEITLELATDDRIPDLVTCQHPGCDQLATVLPGGKARPWRGVGKASRDHDSPAGA